MGNLKNAASVPQGLQLTLIDNSWSCPQCNEVPFEGFCTSHLNLCKAELADGKSNMLSTFRAQYEHNMLSIITFIAAEMGIEGTTEGGQVEVGG